MIKRSQHHFLFVLNSINSVLFGYLPFNANASPSGNISHVRSISPTLTVAAHSNKTASLHRTRRLLSSIELQSLGFTDPKVFSERDLNPQLASNLWDFPCPAYHDSLESASFVATSCSVSCYKVDESRYAHVVDHTATCPLAVAACRAMVECTAVLIRAGGASAALKGGDGSDPQGKQTLEDDSMARLRTSPWWGTPQLPSHGQPRPRSYIVASFGGCGSKMLAGWLATLPRQHTRTVFHLHDRHPPQALRGMRAPVVHRRPPPGGRKTPTSRFFNDPNADMRTKNFGDDATFRVNALLLHTQLRWISS